MFVYKISHDIEVLFFYCFVQCMKRCDQWHYKQQLCFLPQLCSYMKSWKHLPIAHRRMDSHVPNWLRFELDQLEEMGKIGEVNQVSRPKIQKVPEYMGARVEFKRYYLPQLISVGPIHYEKPYVDLGKRYKYMWTAMYLKHTNQTVYDLYQRISSHEKELYGQFTRDCWGEHLSWLLVLDGCTILQVLEKSDQSVHPEQELKVSFDKLVRVHQDLLLLENQIPFQVLKLLCKDEARLMKCLHNFLEIHGVKMVSRPSKEKGNKSAHNGQEAEELKVIVQVDEHQLDEDDPVHLLDYLRRALLMRDLGQIHKEIKINRKCRYL